jgi:serine/threonine protein kinase
MMPSATLLVQAMQQRRVTNREQFLSVVSEFFGPARSSSDDLDVGVEYERLTAADVIPGEGLDSAVRGALGFYLFCHHAERWGRVHDHEDHARADALLHDPHVRQFLYRLYEFDDRYCDPDLTFHTLGTTSFIIKSHYFHNKYHRVVKLIKPWYFPDPVIATQTAMILEMYQRELSHVTFKDQPVSPIVEYSNRHSVIMEFVEGVTLQQYLQELWLRNEANAADARVQSYAALNGIMLSLCGALKACHQHSISHGDLSSTNILVERSDTEFPRLRLIDFGINYLLTRNLGHIDNYSALIATIDPDVMKKKYEATPAVESDVYSLGVILIEGFLGNDYRAESIQILLDAVYDKHPGVGAILDDLLDANPGRRLADVPVNNDPYEFIAARIDAELRLLSLFADAEKKRSFKYIEEFFGIVFLGIPDIVRLGMGQLRNKRAAKSVLVDESQRRLPNPTFERADLLVPLVLNLITVTIVGNRLIPFDSILRGDVNVAGFLEENWPAWLVALSCSIVAARYFVSIFAGLGSKGLPRLPAYSATLCLFAPWIPIMLVLFRYPREWPLFVAIGGTLLVGNNWVWRRFSRTAIRAIDPSGIHISPLMKETEFWLSGWTLTSMITVLCVYLVALLIALGMLNDVTLYAMLITGVVNVRVYFSNLRVDAPKMRTGLQRLCNGYRRATRATPQGAKKTS